ncbi:MAG: efflux RND transporter periplasmic adaptor subunit [Chroococcidiopsidaceae cyanobacterium CP_BM_ER_R8_30]|nr:efflux RND transporter periplasmic adaptor subunit [Chroococcidiopsidaceae cyanobacterium CP_BM_ER_R8_30]
MIRFHPVFSRTVLTTLVLGPLGMIGILSVTVLFPALKDPQSRFYSSDVGYPALQRLTGKPIEVETASVTAKSLEDSVAAPGESVALQQVSVLPLVSGPVEKVYVVDGQRVLQNQPLIQIEQTPFKNAVSTARNNIAISQATLEALQKSAREQLMELKANVENAKEQLAIAETKLKQIIPIVEQGAIKKLQFYDIEALYLTSKNNLINQQQTLASTEINLNQQIESNRLTLENNKIVLQNALRDLNHTVIYAPNDALVSQLNIHSGEVANVKNVSSSNPLMALTQDIVFKAYVDQARINAIKMGDKATIRLVSYPGQTFQGRVIRLNPTVNTQTVNSTAQVGADRQYTYNVWVAVNDLQMPPGLQGYIEFDQAKKSLVIPEDAVTHLSAGEGMVMVAEADKAVVKKVKLGKTFDNQREVIAGLKLGEQVVLTPRALNPGDRLHIQSTEVATDRLP